MSLRFVIWVAAILLMGALLLTVGHCYYGKLRELSDEKTPVRESDSEKKGGK